MVINRFKLANGQLGDFLLNSIWLVEPHLLVIPGQVLYRSHEHGNVDFLLTHLDSRQPINHFEKQLALAPSFLLFTPILFFFFFVSIIILILIGALIKDVL